MTQNDMRDNSGFPLLRFLSPAQRRSVQALADFCGEAQGADLMKIEQLRAYVMAVCADELKDDPLAMLRERYKLKPEYFGAILDGREMEMSSQMLRPSLSKLTYYCYRVGACPLLLSLPILKIEGAEAEQFALALGMAVQLTHILSHIKIAAARGRIYLPQEWLHEEGIGDISPEDIDLHYKAITLTCITLAERGHHYFEESERLSRTLKRRKLLPLLLLRDAFLYELRTLVKNRAFLHAPVLRPGRIAKFLLGLRALRYRV